MKPEQLKVIAEGMGYETEIRSGTFNTLNCYIQARGEKGINHLYFPLTNNDQMVEILNKFQFDIQWFGLTCVIFLNGAMIGEGKTIHEAVCNAAYEHFK